MKKVLFAIAIMIVAIVNSAKALSPEAAALEAEAASMVSVKNYSGAITVYMNELNVLKQQQVSAADPSCISVRTQIANCYSAQALFPQAIATTEESLSILRNAFGTHNLQYIETLCNLGKIYQQDNNKKMAQQVAQTVEQLRNERTYGFVPELVLFKNAEIAHQKNEDAYYCCAYYLNNTFKADNMKQAARYISSWLEQSQDVKVIVSKPMMSWMNNSDNTAYVIAFAAAQAEYSLKNGSRTTGRNQYVNSMLRLLNYYQVMRTRIGSVEIFEDYLRIYKSNPQALTNHLASEYDKCAQTGGLMKMNKVI